MKNKVANLEAETIRRIGDRFGELIETIDDSGFYLRLTGLIREFANCDSIVVIAYHRSRIPLVLHEQLAPRDREALYGSYFEGTYLLSPFYLKWLEGRDTVELYRLREIAPEGFFDSPFYTDYYLGSGLRDEIGFLVPIDCDSSVLLSFGRTASFGRFSAAELALLGALKSVVSSGVRKHAALAANPRSGQLGRQLSERLSNFGTGILTEQEQRVAQLLLRGHSSKSCARELEIAPTTERVHRRNIYAKLGISSQAELFARFFESLAPESGRPRLELAMR